MHFIRPHRAAFSPGDSKGDLGFLLAMQDLAFSMTPDQRISLYTTPNRLSLRVVKQYLEFSPSIMLSATLSPITITVLKVNFYIQFKSLKCSELTFGSIFQVDLVSILGGKIVGMVLLNADGLLLRSTLA
ncbi:hypothetical protein Hanom_Chr06g00557061 [Helianthus anomalus]